MHVRTRAPTTAHSLHTLMSEEWRWLLVTGIPHAIRTHAYALLNHMLCAIIRRLHTLTRSGGGC